MPEKHLTFDDRKNIEELIKKHFSNDAIAGSLSISKYCLSRELKLNYGRDKYSAIKAQKKSIIEKKKIITTKETIKFLESRIATLEYGIINLSLEIEKIKNQQAK